MIREEIFFNSKCFDDGLIPWNALLATGGQREVENWLAGMVRYG